jgi:hypothetical protein
MAERVVVENVPMHVNLGDPSAVIGWATVYTNEETKTSRLEVHLGEEGTAMLQHFEEIAEIKAIGFAGIMRRPERRS